jgi:hypothetical protein
MAGAVLASIPVGMLYFLGQRFVVQGLATVAVKGVERSMAATPWNSCQNCGAATILS